MSLYDPRNVFIALVLVIVFAGYGLVAGDTQFLVIGAVGTVACVILLGIAAYTDQF